MQILLSRSLVGSINSGTLNRDLSHAVEAGWHNSVAGPRQQRLLAQDPLAGLDVPGGDHEAPAGVLVPHAERERPPVILVVLVFFSTVVRF